VVVRPESVRVGTGELRAHVQGSTFLGSIVEYELATGGQTLLAVDPDWMSRGLHAPGEEVALALVPSHVFALPPGTSTAPWEEGSADAGPGAAVDV
jgi:hypothetical protein